MHRKDGSPAQDRRHEEIGMNARERVRDANNKVANQRALLKNMP
jgi:hypothetical protein